MEDEECLPENSDLNVYLRNLGYSDVSTRKNFLAEENALNFEVRKSKSEPFVAGWLDKDIVEQIELLLSTKMLFEEDVSNMEKLLSNFKIVKTGLLKSIFQSYATAFVILFGVCLYWIVGNYIFVLISVFYAYHASDYLWKKHYSQNRIKNLMSALKSNYILLRKTLQFIKENDTLLQNLLENDERFENGFEFFENLKKEFVVSENELIRILSKATKNLINKVPLCDYIENPQYYLCNKYNQTFSEITDLRKLHQVYLLVQSEFLQRVALSLIPNLQINNRDNYRDISKILNGTTINLVKLENKLGKKFKFAFLNGIHFNTSKSEFKLLSAMEPHSNYAVEFISNIHDTSNTLQSLLIKSRFIENKFSREKLPKHVEDELLSIQNDLVACQRNISDSVILLKKLNATESDNNSLKTIEEENKYIESNQDKANTIMVGYSDLDPKVDDEVFEVYLNSDNKKEKFLDDDYDFEDKLKKKLEREYSKNVLKELKSRLVETAKKREAREENALKRKSKPNVEDNISKFDKENQNEKIKEPLDNFQIKNSNNSQVTCNFENFREDGLYIEEMKTESTWPLPRFKRCSLLRKNKRIIPFKKQSGENDQDTDNHKEISKTDEDSSDHQLHKINFNLANSEHLENSLNLINTNFLSSINQARSKILAAKFQEEETFCDTGENSEDEEEILEAFLVEEINEKKFS